MNDDELRDRLHSLGERPVDPTTRRHHLDRIAAVDGASAPRRRRFGPLAVASAGIVGFLAGSTGLAMAGALPGDAQGVAHDVLGVVQLDVPEGKDGKRGPCVSEAAKLDDPDAKQAAKDACPKGPADGDDEAPGKDGKRGPCVAEAAKLDDPDAKQAAKDACPKGPADGDDEAPGKDGKRGPCVAEAAKLDDPDAKQAAKDACPKGPADGDDEAPGTSGEAPRGQDKHADDPCKGKPPWAGPMSKDDREAAKADASRSDCVDDEPDEGDDEPDDPEGDDEPDDDS